MGNCFNSDSAGNGGNNSKSVKQAENEINKKNKEKQDQEKNIHRILLLGPGESGKTTILNQMRKIHGVMRSEQSMEMVVSVIRRNIVKYMALLCVKAKHLEIVVTNNESHEHATKVVTYAMTKETAADSIDINRGFNKKEDMADLMGSNLKLSSICPNDVLESIKFLWKNEPAIQEVLRNRSKFQIHDNVSHFFDSIDRAFDENFEPTDDDILRLRMRTSGFTESTFTVFLDPKQSNGNINLIIPNNNNIDKNKNFKKESFIFIDVGGQRSERRKWMTIMKDDSQIQAVLYVVAISEFDMKCFEDNETMRLDEALELFEKCGREGILSDKSVTIFFNKYDLFTEKLESIINNTNPDQHDFKSYYRDFHGDGTNASQIIDYVFDKFKHTYLKIVGKGDGNEAGGGPGPENDLARRGTNDSQSNNVSNNLQHPHFTPKKGGAPMELDSVSADIHEDMLPLFCHHTCALDTKQIAKLMLDIQLNVITKQLETSGFLWAQDGAQMF